jgi:hypothetical protein
MTDKLTAEETLLQHFQKEYGMHDNWKLSDFFPNNELKAVLSAMEAYKNQSSAVSDIEKEASKLAQIIYKNFENGFHCWADTQSLKEIIEMQLQKIIVSHK